MEENTNLTPTQESSPQESAIQETSAPQYAIEVDERTQRRRVVSLADNAPKQAEAQQQAEPPKAEEPAPQVVQQQQAQPNVETPTAPLFNHPQQEEVKPYQNAAELLTALQQNNVDERRIPMEHALEYAKYKQQQQPPQPQVQQPPLQDASQTQQALYSKIEEAAQANALQILGVTSDELAGAEYTDNPELSAKAKQYDSVVAWQRQLIVNQLQAQRAEIENAAQLQKQIYYDIGSKVDELKAKEPAFNEINVMMRSFYNQMPYEQGSKYAAVVKAYQSGNITPQEAQALQEYYDETRKHYYAQKNGLSVIPKPVAAPTVEQPGNGEQAPPSLQASDLRNITDYRERRRLVGELLASRGVTR